MGHQDRAIITLSSAEGPTISTFDSVSITESFADPLGSYKFTFSPRRQEVAEIRSRFGRGELVGIKVGDCPLATPIVTTNRVTLGKDGPKVEVICKSVLCTPYEGSSNPDMAKKWKDDVSVDKVLADVLELYGFDTIMTDATAHANALTGKPLDGRAAPVKLKSLTLKELQGSEGETAYAVCSRVLSRLGCALHVDWQGALLACRPDYDQAAAYSLVQDSDFSHPGDRILLDPPLSLKESNDGLFSEVVVRGNAPDDDSATVTALPIARVGISDTNRPSIAPYGKVPLAPLKYTKHVYRAAGAPYKPKYMLDKQARDAKACRHSARAVYSARAKDAFELDCSVDGFVSTTGRIWTPNTIADVYIEALEFRENLWIIERGFEQSKDTRRTTLKLIARGALAIEKDE